MTQTSSARLLYTASFLAAVSAIAYELLLASYATFLIGGSVFQYSLVFSLMMASMGIGAFLTDRIKQAHPWFLGLELGLGILSTVAVPLLYWCFGKQTWVQVPLLVFGILMGAFIGMEIPLINRMQAKLGGISNVLFFDYLGGFLGGLVFPLWLLPKLGFFRTAALMGVLNLMVATAFAFGFKKNLSKWLLPMTLLALIWGAGCLYFAEDLRRYLELSLFNIR